MGKKLASKDDDRPAMTIRFASEGERERFGAAAEHEGFNTLTAWIMFHLRRQARETLKD